MGYTRRNYRMILEALMNQGYEFVDFPTVSLEIPARQVILRHDIDFSVSMAHEMAEIDASYGIKSTLSVLLSSPLYNPFTPGSIRMINAIHELGHNVVLHHRVLLGQSAAEISRNVTREMQIMRAFFPYVQPVFIWHNPTASKPPRNMEVPGMINAYSDTFVERMHYVSDSVLRNKPEDFLGALGQHELLHFLLHPFTWISERNDIVSMFGHALNRIILECDKELMLNPAWRERFPNGIPQETLTELEKSLSEGMGGT